MIGLRCGDWAVGDGEQFRTAGAWLASRMKKHIGI